MMEDFEKWKENFQKYLPPTDLWNKIETDLDYESFVKPLLKSLPEHKAPKEIWGHIDMELSGKRQERFKIYNLVNKIAAAIILLALGFGLGRWFQFKSESSNKFLTPTGLTLSGENSDQYDMESVMNQYSRVCKFYPEENPCSLATDLSDLELAKMELENIIRKMGNSDNITRQLRRIELEKSRIIRNMAKRI